MAARTGATYISAATITLEVRYALIKPLIYSPRIAVQRVIKAAQLQYQAESRRYIVNYALQFCETLLVGGRPNNRLLFSSLWGVARWRNLIPSTFLPAPRLDGPEVTSHYYESRRSWSSMGNNEVNHVAITFEMAVSLHAANPQKQWPRHLPLHRWQSSIFGLMLDVTR